MKNSLLKLATFTLAGVASLAHAQSETHDNSAMFDATALAHSCLNCHSSTAGNHPGERLSIPNIYDRDTEATYLQLVAFQQETLPPNTTIMNRLLAAFSEDELKAIAEAVTKIKVEAQQ
ncbi:MAG: hypothetical protein Q4G44_07185 [Alcaligenaceae bacterium]|nr:hypothetical protein [Alcaligenaceae bacterium]